MFTKDPYGAEIRLIGHASIPFDRDAVPPMGGEGTLLLPMLTHPKTAHLYSRLPPRTGNHLPLWAPNPSCLRWPDWQMPLKVASPPFAKPSLGISRSFSASPHSRQGGPLGACFSNPPNISTRMLSLLTLIVLGKLFTFSRALILTISYDQTSFVLVTSPSSVISLTLDILFPWGIASSETMATHKTCHPTSPGFQRFPWTLWFSQTWPYFRRFLGVKFIPTWMHVLHLSLLAEVLIVPTPIASLKIYCLLPPIYPLCDGGSLRL